MEELRVSPSELKMLIDNSRLIGEGFFSKVFVYQDKLIKLDTTLYGLLRANDPYFSKHVIEDHYRFDVKDFQDTKQIEELIKKQQDVKLTKMPLGIVILKDVDSRIDGVSPGIIIPYHVDHESLHKISLDDYKRLLIILRKLLIAVKELADNRIAQEDLANYGRHHDINRRSYNVLYRGDTPQIIDMSGPFVKVNDEFISAENMYRDLSNILLDYFYFYNIKSNTNRDSVTTYEGSEELLNRLESELKHR